jgi:hypothetical protein
VSPLISGSKNKLSKKQTCFMLFDRVDRDIANGVPCSLILLTLMMDAVRSSEMSVLTRATWRHIPEDSILHSHRCDNLKSYIVLNIYLIYKLSILYVDYLYFYANYCYVIFRVLQCHVWSI